MSSTPSPRMLETLDDLNKRQSKLPHVFFLFSIYLLLGIAYYSGSHHFPVLKSLYFSVITYTTVGYGDILPPNGEAKIFQCFYILLGVALTGYLYVLISDVVDDNNQRMRKKHKNRVMKLVTKMAKIKTKSLQVLRGKLFPGHSGKRHHLEMAQESDEAPLTSGFSSSSGGLSEMRTHTSRDIDDGSESMHTLRQAYIQSFEYEFAKLRRKAGLAVLLIAVVLATGALVMGLIEGWGPINSVYWACVTITTVGYGDLPPTSPEGKLFTTVYCIVGCVSMTLAWTEIVKFPLAMKYKQNELKVINQFDETLSVQALHDICNSRALTSTLNLKQTPQGAVSKIEFVVGMLHMMGKISDRDIMLTTAVFDRLDSDRDGIVSKLDDGLATSASMSDMEASSSYNIDEAGLRPLTAGGKLTQSGSGDEDDSITVVPVRERALSAVRYLLMGETNDSSNDTADDNGEDNDDNYDDDDDDNEDEDSNPMIY